MKSRVYCQDYSGGETSCNEKVLLKVEYQAWYNISNNERAELDCTGGVAEHLSI
jgi:hypothetical protein